jgi:hypothetical protein
LIYRKKESGNLKVRLFENKQRRKKEWKGMKEDNGFMDNNKRTNVWVTVVHEGVERLYKEVIAEKLIDMKKDIITQTQESDPVQIR